MIDHKKALSEIMAKKKMAARHSVGAVVELPSKDQEGEIDPKYMIAEEIMNAIHSKSIGDLAKALAASHVIHKHSMDIEDSEM